MNRLYRLRQLSMVGLYTSMMTASDVVYVIEQLIALLILIIITEMSFCNYSVEPITYPGTLNFLKFKFRLLYVGDQVTHRPTKHRLDHGAACSESDCEPAVRRAATCRIAHGYDISTVFSARCNIYISRLCHVRL